MSSNPLEKMIRDVVGALAPKEEGAPVFYQYYKDFLQSGANKGKFVADDLEELARDHPELKLERCAYLSVGGADGTEILYVLEHTPIRYGLLQDFSPEIWNTGRERQQQLERAGKKLDVKIGDVSQQITTCKNQLLQWRREGLIDGLVCSAQAVLHELPSRSPGFDIDFLLGEMFWDWQPCLVYCREPCKPEGWPDRVKLGLGTPPVKSEVMEALANLVKHTVGIQSTVLRAGPNHVTLSGELAVEMLTKLFYLPDFKHEIGEQATYWSATTLASKVQQNLEVDTLGPTRVKHETLTTNSFEDRYHKLGVDARNPANNERLPLPKVFVRIRGIRWGLPPETGQVAATPAPVEMAAALLAARTLDETSFAKLIAISEREKLDFKSRPYRLDNDVAKSKFIKDIIAIANTNPADQPGYILIGVEDLNEPGAHPRRTVLGVAQHPDDAMLQDLVRDKIQPAPSFLYYPFEYEAKSVGVLEIRPSAEILQCRRSFGELQEGQVYTRKGSRNSVASMSDIEDLRRERQRLYPPQPPPVGPEPVRQVETVAPTPQVPASEWEVPAGAQTVGPAVRTVRPRQRLAVTFQTMPSRIWKDPAAEIVGFWNAEHRSITPVQWPMLFQRGSEPATEIGEGYVGLCIPNLDVELEFRERTLVQGPVWSRIKDRVVRQFLAERKGKRMLCEVVAPGNAGRAPYLLLHCGDYDRWLNAAWPFYRGLESALTKTGVHRRPEVMTMVESSLRDYVASELIATGKLAELVPASTKTAATSQSVDVESAVIVLSGLIQQELKFGSPGGERRDAD
jgi:hypothetical protein